MMIVEFRTSRIDVIKCQSLETVSRLITLLCCYLGSIWIRTYEFVAFDIPDLSKLEHHLSNIFFSQVTLTTNSISEQIEEAVKPQSG